MVLSSLKIFWFLSSSESEEETLVDEPLSEVVLVAGGRYTKYCGEAHNLTDRKENR
jgi:hypothetical protein